MIRPVEAMLPARTTVGLLAAAGMIVVGDIQLIRLAFVPEENFSRVVFVGAARAEVT